MSKLETITAYWTHPMCPACLTRNGPLSPTYGCCAECEEADYRAYCDQQADSYIEWCESEDAKYQEQRYLDDRDEYHLYEIWEAWEEATR